MPFISSFLNKTAKVYNIDVGVSTTTGQPIETPIYVKDIKVYLSYNPRDVYQLVDAGQIATGKLSAISVELVLTNQILEVDGVKFRVDAANPAQFKNRVFAYINYLSRYQH
jgi:hypothetical protein